ncbi:unnamed protein product [Clonostachys rosea]|uniref:Heterokaryon incompatibility domain-containing protein n=1 Tax=Bionectria ochroleuca TaxID=29856 RepID=A0ABY6UJB4_BIOOC|nr:unnamed protein product [Clonostachys rosea]
MNSDETVELDRPCQYCRVLSLNDADQGGRIHNSEKGMRYVDFGTIRETSRERDGPLARAGWGDADEPKDFPKIKLKLGYKRQDTLPHMPGFLETASNGCWFCSILRDDVISAWLSEKKSLEKYHNNSVEITSAELSVTEICFRLEELLQSRFSLKQKTGSDIGLTTLHVFFTIKWEEISNDYALAYDVYTDATDPCASWLQCRRTPVKNSMLSPDSINRLRGLVEKTREELPRPKAGTEYLPTRLLEVDSGVDGGVRLVLTKQEAKLKHGDQSTRYMALSYCWGSKEEAEQQLKTKSGSLTRHLNRVDVEKLPKTVADAIQLCKLLEIRYLWVDSLCIIQDDINDWAQEASAMAMVYSNSYITLCILRGSSCLDGFFESKYAPRTLKVHFSSVLDPTVTGKLYLRMLQPPGEKIDRNPAFGNRAKIPADEDLQGAAWYTRGWTFQEAKLSSRKLYVGETMFHISCGTINESADGTGFYGRLDLIDAEASLDKHVQEWYLWVRDYSARKLTYETDRFPALSAIARTFSERFPDEEYVAGLWKSDLHRGLLWSPLHCWTTYAEHFKLPSHGYVAPSWSWAHRSRPVDWVRGVNHECLFGRECEWKDIQIDLDSANPFGSVKSGHILMSAKLLQLLPPGSGRKLTQTENEETLYLGFAFHFNVKSNEEEYITHLRLDWLGYGCEGYPEGPLDEIWMVLLSSSTFQLEYNSWKPTENREVEHPECMLGLLVLPTKNDNEFTKVGLWCSESRGLGGRKLWDQVQPQSVRLV